MGDEAKETKQAAKLKEEEKFLSAKPEDLVDKGAIKRSEFFNGLTGGMAKGLMWGAIALGAVGGLAIAAALSGGIFTTALAAIGTWVGISSGAVTLGGVAAVIAGTLGIGAAIGGITSAGMAMANADDKVEEEVQAMQRKQQMISQRRLQRREMMLNAQAQEIEFEKQSLQMGLSPTMVGAGKSQLSTRDVG